MVKKQETKPKQKYYINNIEVLSGVFKIAMTREVAKQKPSTNTLENRNTIFKEVEKIIDRTNADKKDQTFYLMDKVFFIEQIP